MDYLSQKSQGDEKFIVEKKQTEISRSHYDPEVVATRSRAVRKPRFTKTKAEEDKLSSLPPSSPEMKMGPKYHREKCSGRPVYYTGRNNTVSLKSNNSLKHISATNQLACTPSEFPLSSPISKIATGSSRPTSPSSSSSSDASLASPSPHNPYSSSVYSSTIVSSKPGPRAQQSFPTLSPLSSPIHKHSKVVATQSVPAISSRKDENPRKFPGLSPLSANKFKPASKSSKEKGKRKADALAPFPMSTRDFSSIFPSEGESTDNVRKRKLQIVDEASYVFLRLIYYLCIFRLLLTELWWATWTYVTSKILVSRKPSFFHMYWYEFKSSCPLLLIQAAYVPIVTVPSHHLQHVSSWIFSGVHCPNHILTLVLQIPWAAKHHSRPSQLYVRDMISNRRFYRKQKQRDGRRLSIGKDWATEFRGWNQI